MTMTEHTESTFFAEADRVVRPLTAALRELVGVGPDAPRSEVRLPVHPTLRSRIIRSIETDHLPSTLFHMPGPGGLRRALNASRKSGGDPAVIRRCSKHVDAYESFLRAERINRDALQAMVSNLAPDARTSIVRTNSQAVHKAMANLAGYCADIMVATLIVMPSGVPGRCHLAQIGGFVDLQQLRRGAWFMTSGYGRTSGSIPEPRTLSGEPLAGDRTAALLTAYCSTPIPQFRSRQFPNRRMYQLVEDEIGWRSSATFYFGEVVPETLADPLERPSAAAPPRTMLSSIIATPARHLHFDVLVHDSVWRGAEVSLDTYQIVPHGPVDEATVEDRICERIDLGASLQQFSANDAAFSASRVPRYRDMLDDTLHRLNVRPDELRAYRCEMVYPLHGAQFAMRFEQT